MPFSAVSFLHPRRRLLIWLASLAAAFSLIGFLIAPIIVRQQLIKRASVALKRPVTVETVRINPWALSLTIRGLSVADHDGTELAGWDEFYVNFQLSSLFRGTWYFDEIRFTHPRGRLLVNPDGSLNIADLIPPPAAATAPAAAPSRPPSVTVGHFRVEQGEFVYADRSHSVPFETKLGPTTFELIGFTTRPNRAGAYTFAGATEFGERFAWRGAITFDPLGSTGRIAINDILLPKYAAFHRDLHRLDLLDGRFGIETDYEASLAGGEPAVRVRNGRVTVTRLKLAARGTTVPIVTIPLIQVDGLSADSAKRQAAIASVLVRDADVAVERRADGSIDWLTYLQPAQATPQPGTSNAKPETRNAKPDVSPWPAPAAAWSATLGAFKLENATLRLTDLSNPRPVNLVIDQFGLTLTGAGTKLDQPVTLATALRWNGRGRIAVNGTLTPQPFAADLQVDAADIELRPLDPYLAPFLNVLLTGGTARAKGHVTAALPADGPLALRWEGDAGLAGFATVDGAFSEPFVSFTDLALSKMRVTLNPLAVALDEIALKEPFVRLVVMPDRQINLNAALRLAPPAAAAAAHPETPGPETRNPKLETRNAKPAPSPRPHITVGRIVLTGAHFSATDRSVQPAFTAEVTEFGGTIAGLSSEQLARADVDLTGRLGLAPLRITGRINPLGGDAFTDLKVTFTGIELPPFTPYSGRFTGYAIAKGKLSFSLGYRLSARMLEGENQVQLDQFYLGETIDSPDAVKLPYKLALALLRDRNGRIELALPVRGNLDDPDFKYGRVVWQTLRNLVVKAATAPFALLGGLFGGGHDLSAVEFASGSAALGGEARARLDGLARALTERPGLSLEIDSAPAPALDDAGLRAAKLDAALKARKIRALAQTSTAAIDPATVTLTPEEIARLLAAAYVEAFPPSPAGTTAEGKRLVVGTVPPPAMPARHGNWITRTVRRVLGFPEKNPPAAPPIAVAAGTATVPGADGRPVPLTLEEMRTRLLAAVELTASDFAALAEQRATGIQKYLLEVGKVEAARVFLAGGSTPQAEGPAPRVVFALR